jgi:archaemetzincin
MERPDADQAAESPIALWWIGELPADDGLLQHVRAHVAAEFGCAVAIETPDARPAGTFDERRGQHSSREILRWLLAQPPARSGRRVLGITDVDLFIPVLTFVFGEAQLEGPAAVVSLARLVHGDRQVTAARLAREAVHELGHTFGLRHCGNLEGGWRARACVMARSPSVRAVDAKGARLCGDCRERYRLLQQDGSHVYREHENPHR